MFSDRILNKLFFTAFSIVLISVVFLFNIFAKDLELENISYKITKPSDNKQIVTQIDPILGKSIYLSPFEMKFSLNSLKDQISIYRIEPRSDFQINKMKYEVCFKSLKNVKRVFEDEIIFISLSKDGSFEFSENKTLLSLQITPLDDQNVKVNLVADVKDLKDESLIENNLKALTDSFIVTLVDSPLDNSIDESPKFKILSKAKWWGIDQLLNTYQSVDPKYKKQRLEIDNTIFYMDETDSLIFNGDKWTLVNLDEKTFGYPIAKLKKINSKALELHAWDETADHKYVFAINLDYKGITSSKVDQLITSLKKRTASHYSFMIDKQRFVLKEKDILIKKDSRWKVLKRNIDFDEIKSEELFYLEKFEKRGEKEILIGYFFNPMRTQKQKIELSVLPSNQKILRKRQ